MKSTNSSNMGSIDSDNEPIQSDAGVAAAGAADVAAAGAADVATDRTTDVADSSIDTVVAVDPVTATDIGTCTALETTNNSSSKNFNNNNNSENDNGNGNNNDNNNDNTEEEVCYQEQQHGLQQQYDVIICGTGLVQSILASALARCKKTVLHCDCNDYYGELDAVYSFPYLQTKLNESKIIPSSNNEQTQSDSNCRSTGISTCSTGICIDSDDNYVDRTISLHPLGACNSLTFHSHNIISDPFCNPLTVHDIVLTPYGTAKIVHIPTPALTSTTTPATTTATTGTTTTTTNTGTPPAVENIVCIQLELQSTSSRIPIFVGVHSTQITVVTNIVPTFTDIATKHNKVQESSTSSPSSLFTTDEDCSTNNGCTSPVVVAVVVNAKYMYEKHNILKSSDQYRIVSKQILENHARSFALDNTPTLLYASGPAVTSILKSGVSDYMEFKSCECLFVCNNNNNNNNNNVNDNNNNKSNQKINNQNNSLLSRVPCSKNDVFATQMLSPMEKRRLMKFLQLAYDYAIILATTNTTTTNTHTDEVDEKEVATTTEGAVPGMPPVVGVTTQTLPEEEIHSRNEKHLNAGRALGRPQNKSIATNEMQILQDCIALKNKMSFEEYLSCHQNLSPSMIQLVRYALALDVSLSSSSSTSSTGCSVEKGMKQLCQHMMSLGHFGTTAFLIPLYGSGEMSQAFCRSAAVYGATYLLRTTPLSIVWTMTAPITSTTTITTNTTATATTTAKTIEPKEDGNHTVINTNSASCQNDEGSNVIANSTKCNNEVGTLKGVVIDFPNDDSTFLSSEEKMSISSTTQHHHRHQANASRKLILCKHVVVPKQAAADNVIDCNHTDAKKTRQQLVPTKKCRVFRRISILNGKPWFPTTSMEGNTKDHPVLPHQQQVRYAVIIPPETTIRYSTMMGNADPNSTKTETIDTQPNIVTKHVIHALFLDETVNVAPNIPSTGGCTIVHLTMTTPSIITSKAAPNSYDSTTIKNTVDNHDTILQYALQSILDDCNTNYKNMMMKQKRNVTGTTTTNDTRESIMMMEDDDDGCVDEIFNVNFSYEADCDNDDGDDESWNEQQSTTSTRSSVREDGENNTGSTNAKPIVPGLHWIHRSHPGITPDECFQQAECIFHTICPGMEFLELSKEMVDTIQERYGNDSSSNTATTGRNRMLDDDEDTDRYVLESAVDMIVAQKEEKE